MIASLTKFLVTAALPALAAVAVVVPTATGTSGADSATHQMTPVASCWGDWCSGQDPDTSGCSADAYTLAHAYLYGLTDKVELRWSPSCKTEWARIPANAWRAGSTLKVVQPSTGYTQSGIVASGSGYSWTRMIYSPTRCVYAYWYASGWGAAQTACV